MIKNVILYTHSVSGTWCQRVLLLVLSKVHYVNLTARPKWTTNAKCGLLVSLWKQMATSYVGANNRIYTINLAFPITPTVHSLKHGDTFLRWHLPPLTRDPETRSTLHPQLPSLLFCLSDPNPDLQLQLSAQRKLVLSRARCKAGSCVRSEL